MESKRQNWYKFEANKITTFFVGLSFSHRDLFSAYTVAEVKLNYLAMGAAVSKVADDTWKVFLKDVDKMHKNINSRQ